MTFSISTASASSQISVRTLRSNKLGFNLAEKSLSTRQHNFLISSTTHLICQKGRMLTWRILKDPSWRKRSGSCGNFFTRIGAFSSRNGLSSISTSKRGETREKSKSHGRASKKLAILSQSLSLPDRLEVLTK